MAYQYYNVAKGMGNTEIVHVKELGTEITIPSGLSEAEEKSAVKAAADAFLAEHPIKTTE